MRSQFFFVKDEDGAFREKFPISQLGMGKLQPNMARFPSECLLKLWVNSGGLIHVSKGKTSEPSS